MKEIKDYLHLYLGARHRYKYVDSDNWSVWIELTPNRLPRLDDLSISGIELELRPLSDMTDAEAFELCEYYGEYGDMPGRREYESYINGYGEKIISWGRSFREKWSPIRCSVWKPEQIRLLLSKHFDMFGLIESGMAIAISKTSKVETSEDKKPA